MNTLFPDETAEQRLRMLNIVGQRPTKLTSQNCGINSRSSWFIGCHGERVPLQGNASKMFSLNWQNSRKRYRVKVRTILYTFFTFH